MRTRAEAPGPGDTYVSGTALITLTQDQGKVRSTCAGYGQVRAWRIRCRLRVIGMARGEIVFDGPPGAIEDSHLLAIYGGEGWLE